MNTINDNGHIMVPITYSNQNVMFQIFKTEAAFKEFVPPTVEQVANMPGINPVEEDPKLILQRGVGIGDAVELLRAEPNPEIGDISVKAWELAKASEIALVLILANPMLLPRYDFEVLTFKEYTPIV